MRKRAASFRRASRRRTQRVCLRARSDRLVGLLDQHPRARSAALVLPIDGGPPSRIAYPTRSGLGARTLRGGSRGPLRGESLSRYGDFSHWLNRVSRELPRRRIVSRPSRFAASARAREKPARSARTSLAISPAPYELRRISGTPWEPRANFSRRSHRSTLQPCA